MIANYLFEILIAIPILLVLAFNLWEKYSEFVSERHCPNCNQNNASQLMKEELVGIFRKSKLSPGFKLARWLPDSETSNNYGVTMYEKYKIYNKCIFCGHEWISYKSKKQ